MSDYNVSVAVESKLEILCLYKIKLQFIDEEMNKS